MINIIPVKVAAGECFHTFKTAIEESMSEKRIIRQSVIAFLTLMVGIVIFQDERLPKPADFFPASMRMMFEDYLTEPVFQLTEKVSNISADQFYQPLPLIQKFKLMIIQVASEEFVFRLLIQKTALPLLLKPFPMAVKKVLGSAPARIGLTASIFALSHVQHWEKPLGCFVQLLNGIYHGVVAERNVALAFFDHLQHNFFLYGTLIVGSLMQGRTISEICTDL